VKGRDNARNNTKKTIDLIFILARYNLSLLKTGRKNGSPLGAATKLHFILKLS
jgi:hypothetical protein